MQKQLRICNGGYIDYSKPVRTENSVPAMPRLIYQNGKLITNTEDREKIQMEELAEEEKKKQFATRFNSRKMLMTIPMQKI